MTSGRETNNFIARDLTRREFVTSSLAAVGATSMFTTARARGKIPTRGLPSLTIKNIIDLILKDIPGAPFMETVDTLKAGSLDQVVSGIVTTMFATVPVIRKAIDVKANFIIAHEPTYYNHLDDVSWLSQDKVYQFKNELLRKNSIAIWRFHDYWHARQPDGVLTGFLKSAGWEKFYDEKNPHMISIAALPLGKMVNQLKEKLGIPHVRIVGDLAQVCQRIALMPGAAGGKRQIQLLQNEQPDVLICGEVQEWETSEYIRDSRAMGKPIALVVLGHAVSEEPGMQELADWLTPKLTGLTITHVPAGDPFTWV